MRFKEESVTKKHRNKITKSNLVHKKNRKLPSDLIVGIYLILFILLSLVNAYILIVFNTDFLTGSAVAGPITSGTVSFSIQEKNLFINISSPENITYEFNFTDPYTINLNVSANFEPEDWWFSLYDVRHSSYEYFEQFFIPNSTFEAVRWENLLIVYANSSSGTIAEANVSFFVFINNTAPTLEEINETIYLCEGDVLTYIFGVNDSDGDMLDFQVDDSRVPPLSPIFFVYPDPVFVEGTRNVRLISPDLPKSHVGGINGGYLVHGLNISVTDGDFYDWDSTNLIAIEINNEPEVTPVGVHTIYLRGDNSTFYYETQVEDTEDGDQDSGNFDFSLNFINSTNLFEISDSGVMNYTTDESVSAGVYNITLCVDDSGIDNPYVDILEYCNQTGESISACHNFSLTITDENRAPTIVDYYPVNFSSVPGDFNFYFNVTEYDPDGTYPDAYWFVDNQLREYDSGSLFDEFRFSFGCGVSGRHYVRVDVTDGLLNDSFEWGVDIENVDCPVDTAGGGGGGFGCSPQWVCGFWSVCQNAELSLGSGLLSGKDFRFVDNVCNELAWDNIFCGFQTRICSDLKNCNYTINKPAELQECYFTEDPSCFDRLRNCHDNSCEVLIDCGGPCEPCPTCSDGIKNQNEEKVDCGGPCPWKCVPEKPFVQKKGVIYVILLIILILIVLLIIKIVKIMKVRKKLDGGS